MKVFVGMSGGVDSSVAAMLLKVQGREVVGCFIKSWDGLPTKNGVKFREQCRWKEDRRDAMRVAAQLKIPFVTYDLTKAYQQEVIEYFFKEYEAGRTPNPDVMCNREIKFKRFLNAALVDGADAIATGHYARVTKDSTYHLLSGVDSNKDQSYFLWTLGQKELAKSIFPIGHLTKPEVRALAEKAGLATAKKPDSQGICFVGEVSMHDFLGARLPQTPGAIVTNDGKVIGEHIGLPYYTIGQRQGIGVASGLPYYVAEKRLTTNELVVAEGQNDASLFCGELIIKEFSWTNTEPKEEEKLMARLRHRQPLQTISVTKSGHDWRVIFDKPQRAVTPGQSLVIYRGEELIGGGVIQ